MVVLRAERERESERELEGARKKGRINTDAVLVCVVSFKDFIDQLCWMWCACGS